MNSHMQVLSLLVSLLLGCLGLAVICGLLGVTQGMHTLFFMAAEVRDQRRCVRASLHVPTVV